MRWSLLYDVNFYNYYYCVGFVVYKSTWTFYFFELLEKLDTADDTSSSGDESDPDSKMPLSDCATDSSLCQNSRPSSECSTLGCPDVEKSVQQRQGM